ncbi:D-alanyl-D-alanine carboxypeptidase/D-alanyl-D-alanine endopeptidase [Pseudoponticoccus marisrubri]|uniref:D-alanyl-D-alanine carboxypeptidase n=1 Tax=Pseudoponticoccus marisrubri TaxID=1685382 RepID=A0A0W7WQB0_9RHOB|nr:D-alanyl-D-alanine carboxypeptidase/D-alanyl-D-alanine-endopeptidase [Pseudoponticoccus marisrubri]KUF12798.1 D-alanyl-D-alanine carboxypeptidase [Pseudoponticoccus marisrubri]
MTKTLPRRAFLSLAAAAGLSAAAGPAVANAPARSLRPVARSDDLLRRLQTPPEELIARARLDGRVGFAVADMADGKMLEDHAPNLGLPPASVAKALTAAYALEVLGPAYHFETRVIATGGITDGVVQGDLVLAGGGDPTLDTDALAALAAGVKAAGITGVTGGLKVWGGELPFVRVIDPLQPDHVGYSPAVSGLNLNYNRVHFEWRRAGSGYTVSMDARSGTHRPDVTMARMGVVARDMPVYTYSDSNGRDEWTVARGALGDGGARWLPVRKPELYAGEVFQTFVRAQGIQLGAPTVIDALPAGETVARHESAPLRIILRDMLKWSTNLTAEAVGMMATRVRTGAAPASLTASAAEMSAWGRESFGLDSMAFVDHSGLGEDSRISARDMMTALYNIRRRKGLKPLLKAFPMRDSQRRIISDHPLKVHAKTGTLNFVSGLAGFVDLPDGTELVFAIFTSDMDRRAELSRAQRERPPGGREWNRRAKALQQALIERWGVLYSA